MAPLILIPKDVYTSLNESINDKYNQAILYGLREDCDNKNTTIHIKGFIPCTLKDSNLTTVISTFLNNNGQTIIGWFSNISYKYIISKKKENNTLENILQKFSSKNFETFYTVLLNAIFIKSAKIKKLAYNQENLNQMAKSIYPILPNIIGLCMISDNIFAYHTPNINIKNIINNIIENVFIENSGQMQNNEEFNFKRKFPLKNEMNFSKDSPLSIISQNLKKRKNEMDNSNSSKKKKIFNSINDVQYIPKTYIKILYGQSSEYLNSCINKSSLQYSTDYDEISFMGLLNNFETDDYNLKRIIEKNQSACPPESIIKKEKMISDYITKVIGKKLDSYREACEEYENMVHYLLAIEYAIKNFSEEDTSEKLSISSTIANTKIGSSHLNKNDKSVLKLNRNLQEEINKLKIEERNLLIYSKQNSNELSNKNNSEVYKKKRFRSISNPLNPSHEELKLNPKKNKN